METQSGEETLYMNRNQFRERLTQLEAAIPGAATDVQPLLSRIHRSALRLHDQLQHIERNVLAQINGRYAFLF